MQAVATRVAEFHEQGSFVVGGMAFNNNGTELVTNGMLAPPEVHVWNWRQRQLTRVLPMNALAGAGDAIVFGADGSTLAVGHTRDLDGTIVRIWDTSAWSVAHDIAGPLGTFDEMGIGFSSDGKVFVRTNNRMPGAGVIVYRTDTWAELWSLESGTCVPRTLSISPDSRWLAVAGVSTMPGPSEAPFVSHPEILIFSLLERRLVKVIAAFPDENAIQTLAWSPDGKVLAAGAIVQGTYPGPHAVRLFDPVSGVQLLGEASNEAFVSGLQYSKDGRYLIEGYIDGAVHIWDGEHKHLLQAIPVDERFRSVVSISSDSRHFAIAVGKELSVWELKERPH